MLNAFKTKKDISNASARVVDGKLILSLPDAENPVVWQMDLSTTKASALEVSHNAETETYSLVLKTPRGETVDIAPFKDKAFAVEGLMAASGALENAYGQIRNTESTPANDTQSANQPNKRSSKKWFIAIGGIILVVALFNIWIGQAPRTPGSQNAASPQNYRAQATPPAAGVAMSADDFLRAQ